MQALWLPASLKALPPFVIFLPAKVFSCTIIIIESLSYKPIAEFSPGMRIQATVTGIWKSSISAGFGFKQGLNAWQRIINPSFSMSGAVCVWARCAHNSLENIQSWVLCYPSLASSLWSAFRTEGDLVSILLLYSEKVRVFRTIPVLPCGPVQLVLRLWC